MALSIKMLTQLTETLPHSIWTGMKQIVMHSTAMMPHGPWPLHSIGQSLVRLSVNLSACLSCHTSNVQSTVLGTFYKRICVLYKHLYCEKQLPAM